MIFIHLRERLVLRLGVPLLVAMFFGLMTSLGEGPTDLNNRAGGSGDPVLGAASFFVCAAVFMVIFCCAECRVPRCRLPALSDLRVGGKSKCGRFCEIASRSVYPTGGTDLDLLFPVLFGVGVAAVCVVLTHAFNRLGALEAAPNLVENVSAAPTTPGDLTQESFGEVVFQPGTYINTRIGHLWKRPENFGNGQYGENQYGVDLGGRRIIKKLPGNHSRGALGFSESSTADALNQRWFWVYIRAGDMRQQIKGKGGDLEFCQSYWDEALADHPELTQPGNLGVLSGFSGLLWTK
eukprot:COSAG02_NODE_5868_length_3976_cov_2.533918_4_plen_294_part_00